MEAIDPMGTSVNADRRDPTAPRRAFKGTVDLSIPEDSERLVANAIDLSLGGMQLRAPVLPNVGERLGFRFQLEDGANVSTQGEVVWSGGEGERDGAFGVRFVDLSPSVRAAIARATTRKDDRMVSPGQRIDDTRVKLFIDGMDAPFRAKIRTRTDGAMVLGSDLSFLRIGDKVNVEGAAHGMGILDGVDVEIDPKTQVARLVLTIDTEMGPKPAKAAASHPNEVAPAVAAVAAVAAETKAPEASRPVVRATNESVTAPAVGDVHRAEAVAPRGQKTAALASDADGDDEGFDDEDEADEAAPGWLTRGMAAVQGAYGKVTGAVAPAVGKAREVAAGAVGSVKARLQGEAQVEEAAQARPRLRQQVVSGAVEADAPKKSPLKNKRVLALAALATALSVGIVAVAVSGGPSTTTPQPTVAVTAEGATDPNAALDPNGAPNTAGSATPETVDPNAADPNAEAAPGAFPEPRALAANANAPADLRYAANSPAADVRGQSPVIAQRAQPVRRVAPLAAAVTPRPAATARTVTAPAARPAAQVASTNAVIGSAAVRTGTTLHLRMDGPITALQGPGASGAAIVVRVPGRRSLDVASPMVRLDPRLAGAGIRNSAQGAELTLRFRTAAPPFSARARGNTLEIVLGPTPGVRVARR